MLELDLNRLFKARGIQSGYQFLRDLGISHTIAFRMSKGEGKSLNLEKALLICKKLNCTPNDLLKYTPNGDTLPEDHALNQLVQNETPVDMMETINHLPMDKIAELQRHIEQLGKG